MLRVKIITVGKLKEKYLREAQQEYLKRLSSYCKAEVCEINEERLPDNPSDSDILRSLDKEADRIIKEIPQGAYVYSLCIEGRGCTSEEFGGSIENIAVSGKSTVVFIIGSSFGLSDRVKAASNKKLSFSRMTFPHQLARIMLLEQVYRAFAIINNSKYHK